MSSFEYDEAFCRNIGLLTEEEQHKLKEFTIAIPGMGGVGGAILISLVRQGFEKFKIADMDEFELKNFNRQYGAELNTIKKKKAEVMKKKALEINPDCQIEVYDKGINKLNLDEFLNNVNLAVDGLDFFEVETRRLYFNKAHSKKIPLITAGPIGFSTAYLIFMPDGPNFDEYFNVQAQTPYKTKLLSFAVGLAPSMLQRKYMKNVSFKSKAGPSSIGAVDLCAGVVTVNAIKILLNKGKIYPVPYYNQFDLIQNKFISKKILFHKINPIQKLKVKIAEKLLEK